MASSPRRYKLAAFTKNRTNPAYIGARLGADRVAARLGCSLRHHVPTKPDDVEEQRGLLAAVLAEGVDAILLAPTHATALNDLLQRARSKGIPILCMVSQPEQFDCTCFVGSDDRALARGIADHLFDSLGGRGDVVTLEGHPNAMTTAPRTAGFRDAAAARPGVRIKASRAGDFQRDGGCRAMAELLGAEPRIDGVLAANDFMAIGALDAMREAGRLMPIVGINATPEGVAAVKRGDLVATSSFDAMKMACLGVEAAVRVLRGETVPRLLMLPVEVVDRSNCAAWDKPYAERSLPEWRDYVKA
ncbi:MAG: sugar ABC transporter substrate-binding protein [Hyphomicrobiaceae bacterium]